MDQMLRVAAAVLSLLLLSPSVLAQSQAEMNRQAVEALELAEANMEKVYRQILKEHAGEKSFLADLKEAQKAWRRYVEFHLKTMFPLKEGEDPTFIYGSIYHLEFAGAKATMVEQRTGQLKLLIE